MATQAQLVLTSDVSGDPTNVDTGLVTLTKAGGTNELDQTTGVGRVHLRSTTEKLLLASNTNGNDLASKVYIINKSEDASLYVTVKINARTIGKLYGGDFMFIPWSQTDPAADIKVAATNLTSSTGDIPVEYVLFHEDTDYLADA
mgnify:FL=1